MSTTSKPADLLQVTIHGTKLKELVFDFYAILKLEEARNLFQAHLATEFNTEPLEFVMAVEKLESLANDTQATTAMAYDICETFIQPLQQDINKATAKKQINVSAATLAPVISTLKANNDRSNWTQQQVSAVKLFEPVKNGIILELFTESFPRFVRSKMWVDFLKKKDEQYLKSVSSLKQAIQFQYKDEDFVPHVVTDSDFLFMDSLLSTDDYDWDFQGYQKLAAKHSVVNAFFTIKQYLPHVSWAKLGSVAKFVCVLPFALEHVVKYRFTGCTIVEFDNNVPAIHEYEYYDNASMKQLWPNCTQSNNRDCAVISFDCFLPFPLTTKRRYLNVSSVEYNASKEQYLLIHKPCQHSKHALPKGWLEFYDYQGILLRKLDSERTLMIECHIFNLGGWGTSQTLNRITAFDRAKGMQKTMISFLQKAKEGKVKISNSNDNIMKLVQAAHGKNNVAT